MDNSNEKELLIGPDNKFKRISTSRLLYHSSPNINHWYNSMRHYYEENNLYGSLGNLKRLITTILLINSDTKLGKGNQTGMSDYYQPAKDSNGNNIGLTHQKVVFNWWNINKNTLSWDRYFIYDITSVRIHLRCIHI